LAASPEFSINDYNRCPDLALLKDRTLERPIIAQGRAVHFVAVGPSVEEATEDVAAGQSTLRSRAPA
jgi:hypothetical protein